MPTVAEVKQQVGRIWQQTCHSELGDDLHTHLRQQALLGVQAALESALREEVVVYRAQSSLPGMRLSGSYTRQVLTSHGLITDLQQPKLRCGNRERPWQILTRYQLSMQHVLDQALYLYTIGLSLRDLQEALYVVFGHLLSREAINRVTRAAQSPMEHWHQQPIGDTPPVLLVDGVWVQVMVPTGETWTDKSGHLRQHVRGEERVVVTAMGVWPNGQRQILDYQMAAAEDSEAWKDLFAALVARGLDAKQVKLVVSDGSTGVPAALEAVFPHAKQQRCVVHKVRGLERCFQYHQLERDTPEGASQQTPEAARRLRRYLLTQEAYAIFEAPTREEAVERLELFRENWREREGEVVRRLCLDIGLCLNFYAHEVELHPLIRSTNLLERFFREFRTKADEIGAFPNETACLTVFHLIVIRDHAKHDRGPVAKTR
jgi:transposase-like protein